MQIQEEMKEPFKQHNLGVFNFEYRKVNCEIRRETSAKLNRAVSFFFNAHVFFSQSAFAELVDRSLKFNVRSLWNCREIEKKKGWLSRRGNKRKNNSVGLLFAYVSSKSYIVTSETLSNIGNLQQESKPKANTPSTGNFYQTNEKKIGRKHLL